MSAARVLRWPAALLVSAALIGLPFSAAASSGAAVRGGGVVDGPRGLTSQLGFTATSSGGSFLCVMAGRSGGFPFGPWQNIQQMRVEGRVTPGTLSITDGVATFTGTATIHVIGTTASGEFAVTLRDIPFISTQTAGGADLASHVLDVPGIGAFAGSLKTGRITIWP